MRRKQKQIRRLLLLLFALDVHGVKAKRRLLPLDPATQLSRAALFPALGHVLRVVQHAERHGRRQHHALGRTAAALEPQTRPHIGGRRLLHLDAGVRLGSHKVVRLKAGHGVRSLLVHDTQPGHLLQLKEWPRPLVRLRVQPRLVHVQNLPLAVQKVVQTVLVVWHATQQASVRSRDQFGAHAALKVGDRRLQLAQRRLESRQFVREVGGGTARARGRKATRAHGNLKRMRACSARPLRLVGAVHGHARRGQTAGARALQR